MQQTIDRTGEESMISMEEYLRRKNMIRGNEFEDTESVDDIHSKEKNEKKAEESKKINALKWGVMLELAALMYV